MQKAIIKPVLNTLTHMERKRKTIDQVATLQTSSNSNFESICPSTVTPNKQSKTTKVMIIKGGGGDKVCPASHLTQTSYLH